MIIIGLYTGTAFSLRVLYLEGFSRKYGNSAEKQQTLDQLCSAISNLSTEQCITLLQVYRLPFLLQSSRVCLPQCPNHAEPAH